MEFTAYFPYRSAEARDAYLAHYDALAASQWPAASEERMVPTSFGETFVRISGPAGAPPLVLLPGAGATSLMWTPNVKALSEACRVFAVDRMGEVGRNICTKPVQCMDDLLAWLNEFFDALDLRSSVNLAGVSYGGWLTAAYAIHFPARLASAVLLAPGGGILHVSAEFLARIGLSAVRKGSGIPSLFRWLFTDLAKKDPKQFADTLDQIMFALDRLQPRYLSMPTYFSDEEWSRLRVPTLFVVGEHEKIYSINKAIRRLKRVAPQVGVKIVPDAGHDMTIVQADLINRAIIDFVKTQQRSNQAS